MCLPSLRHSSVEELPTAVLEVFVGKPLSLNRTNFRRKYVLFN